MAPPRPVDWCRGSQAVTLPLLMIPGLNCTAALWGPQLCTLGRDAWLRLPITRPTTPWRTWPPPSWRTLRRASRSPACRWAATSLSRFCARRRSGSHGLALLDTQARADSPEAQELRRQQIAIAERGGFARIPDLQIPKLLAARHHGDVALTGTVRAMASATGADAFVRRADRDPEPCRFAARARRRKAPDAWSGWGRGRHHATGSRPRNARRHRRQPSRRGRGGRASA